MYIKRVIYNILFYRPKNCKCLIVPTLNIFFVSLYTYSYNIILYSNYMNYYCDNRQQQCKYDNNLSLSNINHNNI